MCFGFLQIIATKKITKKHTAFFFLFLTQGPKDEKASEVEARIESIKHFVLTRRKKKKTNTNAQKNHPKPTNHKSMHSMPLDHSLTSGEHGRGIGSPAKNTVHCYSTSGRTRGKDLAWKTS